jgi:hypothetical protein
MRADGLAARLGLSLRRLLFELFGLQAFTEQGNRCQEIKQAGERLAACERDARAWSLLLTCV